MSDIFAETLRLQQLAREEGFDWSERTAVWDKLAEELGELREAAGQSPERFLDELGDVLFMLANLAYHYRAEPGPALAAANAKFRRRFDYVMRHRAEYAPAGDPQRLAQMEARWQQAKRGGL